MPSLQSEFDLYIQSTCFLHLHYTYILGLFIRCFNPEGLIIRPQKNNKNPQTQPSTKWANWSFSADSEQWVDGNECSLMPN